MKTPRLKSLANTALTLLLALIGTAAITAFSADSNTLTDAEKSGGWKLLFDGKSLAGWTSFKKSTPPDKGWDIQDGWLHHIAKAGGGDLVSADKFSEFELSWEWRIADGGNSGLKYFIADDRKGGAVGHEYQMLDDDKHPDGKKGLNRQTAAFYDVLDPVNRPVKKPGEINQSRVLVQGMHVEHWLNGAKVLEYELGSDALKAAIAKSKFKGVEGFGTRFPGRLLLQDHGDEVFVRNLKLRDLTAK